MMIAESLLYSRQAVEAGQWWRLLSAHLAHQDWSHLLLNLLGILAVLSVARHQRRLLAAIAVMFIAALAISVGLWLMPWVDWYLGLSGVLYAAAVFVARQHSRLAFSVVATLLLARVVVSASQPLSPVLLEAHLIGLLAGVIAGRYGAFSPTHGFYVPRSNKIDRRRLITAG